MRTKIIQNT